MDRSSPLRRGFVPRGNFAAMPLAFASVSTPVPAASSRVTALACRPGPGACVLGATSGLEVHVFLAAVRPPQGYVLELAILPQAREAVGIVLLPGDKPPAMPMAVAANGPQGGVIARLEYNGHLADGIQEWSFQRPRLQAEIAFPGERVLDLAVVDGKLLCLTQRRLAWVELPGGEVRDIAGLESVAVPRLGLLGDGRVLATTTGELLVLEVASGNIRHLPPPPCAAASGRQAWGWAPTAQGSLLGADPEGGIFVLDGAGRVRERGHAPLAPVQVMACLPDGRIYGMCGRDLGRFFHLPPGASRAEDYGPVAAVLGARRYAYEFACAVVGPDGEIYLGEDDRGGHLWIYFPPVAP